MATLTPEQGERLTDLAEQLADRAARRRRGSPGVVRSVHWVTRQVGELLATGAVLKQPGCASSGCPRRCMSID